MKVSALTINALHTHSYTSLIPSQLSTKAITYAQPWSICAAKYVS
jgi:hypothetical protein